jgi:polyhydroxyalkanoate synthesis regulator phasin
MTSPQNDHDDPQDPFTDLFNRYTQLEIMNNDILVENGRLVSKNEYLQNLLDKSQLVSAISEKKNADLEQQLRKHINLGDHRAAIIRSAHSEIDALKKRLRELEANSNTPQE